MNFFGKTNENHSLTTYFRSVEVTQIHYFFRKIFVKAMLLLNKSLKRDDLTNSFFSESKFFMISQNFCVTVRYGSFTLK